MSLPTELIAKILEHVPPHDDRHTLAQCMRVSTTFNRIAAPLLYRTIKLRDLEQATLLAAGYHDEQSECRGTLTKKELLDLCEVIYLPNHQPLEFTIQWICPFKDEVWQGIEWEVPTVNAPEQLGDLFAPMEDNTWSFGCRCPDLFAPQKFVVELKCYLSSAPHRDILVYEGCGGFHQDHHQKKRAGSDRTFSNAEKQATRFTRILKISRSNDPTLRYQNYSTAFNDGLEKYIRRQCMPALWSDGPDDLVLVGLESMEGPDGIPYTNEYCNKISKDYVAHVAAHGRSGERKSPEELAKVNILFIDMQTYLEEYDWKGIFEEHEVQEMLDAIASKTRKDLEEASSVQMDD